MKSLTIPRHSFVYNRRTYADTTYNTPRPLYPFYLYTPSVLAHRVDKNISSNNQPNKFEYEVNDLNRSSITCKINRRLNCKLPFQKSQKF